MRSSARTEAVWDCTSQESKCWIQKYLGQDFVLMSRPLGQTNSTHQKFLEKSLKPGRNNPFHDAQKVPFLPSDIQASIPMQIHADQFTRIPTTA